MKKLFTALMCIMMIACFMPTMAFADGSPTEPELTIIPANLADCGAKAEDQNVIPKELLYKDYRVDFDAASKTVTIEATNLIPHYNSVYNMGKWVGFAIKVPDGTKSIAFQTVDNGVTSEVRKIEGTKTDENTKKEILQFDEFTYVGDDGAKYIAFYWNAATKNRTEFKFAFGKEEMAPSLTENAVVLNVKTTLTDTKPTGIVAAPLSDQTVSNPIPADKLFEKYALHYVDGTATITVKGMKTYENGNYDKGKWVGVAMPIPEGKDSFALWVNGVKKANEVIPAKEKLTIGNKQYVAFWFDYDTYKQRTVSYAFYKAAEGKVPANTGLETINVEVKEETNTSGASAYVPTLPTTPTTPTAPTTPTTPEQKPATVATKTAANTAITTAAAANKYDKAEQAEVDQIVKDAEAKIKEAKTEDEVNAIKKDAEAKLDKILTTEEKVTIASLGEVSKRDFGAKSKKITKKNGKKAVTLSWAAPEGVDVDGYEIFRSTKKNSGYGTEPYFETTKTSYTNSKGLKSGKTYYYKVRAFVEINGERHYTDYSTKASRKI